MKSTVIDENRSLDRKGERSFEMREPSDPNLIAQFFYLDYYLIVILVNRRVSNDRDKHDISLLEEFAILTGKYYEEGNAFLRQERCVLQKPFCKMRTILNAR